MSDKIKDTEKMNENEEITTEDLDDVAGGKTFPSLREIYVPRIGPFKPSHVQPVLNKYGGPLPKPLTPEEQKKLEREKKIEQILKLARELDEDRSKKIQKK